MTEEIKELLEYFSSDNIHLIQCEHKWCDVYGYEKSQMKKDLLDYIIDLQDDNITLVKERINSNSMYIRKIYKLENEIERLNNIINELEKYIDDNYFYDDVGMKIFDVSLLEDKLKELKESGNNE